MGISWLTWGPQRRFGRTAGWVAAGAALATLAGCTINDDRPAGKRAATSSRAGADGRAPAARFTVAGTGDFLLHSILIEQAASDSRAGEGYDFMPMLAALRPVISRADLGVCHVETPLATANGPFSGYPTFNSPPQIVDAIRKLGYDTCSTASNHTIDQGAAGVGRTLGALDAAGIKHAGSARSAREANQTNILNVKGVRVAHLSYTQDTNGIPKPAGKPWAVNDGLNADRILADAARAKSAGAEVVLLSLHWGEEYQHAATTTQRQLAARLLGSPNVDLILGDHVHVVQPYEQINGKWVAYGMGNQVANPVANEQTTHEGLVARFTFSRGSNGRWNAQPSFVPTRVVPGPPIRLRVLSGRSEYPQTVARTTDVVRSLGFNVPVAAGSVTGTTHGSA